MSPKAIEPISVRELDRVLRQAADRLEEAVERLDSGQIRRRLLAA